jgi:hypothetical protein
VSGSVASGRGESGRAAKRARFAATIFASSSDVICGALSSGNQRRLGIVEIDHHAEHDGNPFYRIRTKRFHFARQCPALMVRRFAIRHCSGIVLHVAFLSFSNNRAMRLSSAIVSPGRV